ncbi:MAG: hypothetical protein AseanaTS_18150 [Candidatus Pelagadaptatus aseana]|uniref:AsmA family protein n=1 Tax=Candidatus Pelagadaptatus aseana TaxID=3120508 RepID=UPI0039B2867C
MAEVDIQITNGRGELKGLTVANPQGFSNANAFELGNIALQVDPGSLTEEVIVIDEITISGARLLAEMKGMGQTNLQALLDNVQGDGSGAKDASASAKTDSSAAPEVKLAVKSFTFSDSVVELATEEWGDRTIKLPAIKVNDIGSKDAGLTPEQLAEAMIQPVLKSAESSVKKDLEALARDKAEEKLKEKLNEKLGDEKANQLNQLKSLFGK